MHTTHRPEHVQALRAIKHINSIPEIDGAIKGMNDKAYDDCLEELHNITDIPLPSLRREIDTDRILVRDLLSRKNPLATHDPNLPAPLYQILRKTYEDEELTLDSTKVKFIENSSIAGLTAQTQDGVFYRGYLISKPKLIIYGSLTKMSEEYQDFIFRHEKYHHLLQHGSMTFIVAFSNGNYTTKLTSLKEIEADIAAAASSKNSTLACTAAHYRCSFHHQEIIDGNKHCEQLQRLCALNLRKDELLKTIS